MESLLNLTKAQQIIPLKKEYNDDNNASFPASSKVYHSVFGEGIVLFSEGSGENEKVTVHFKKEGVKKIIANFLEKA